MSLEDEGETNAHLSAASFHVLTRKGGGTVPSRGQDRRCQAGRRPGGHGATRSARSPSTERAQARPLLFASSWWSREPRRGCSWNAGVEREAAEGLGRHRESLPQPRLLLLDAQLPAPPANAFHFLVAFCQGSRASKHHYRPQLLSWLTGLTPPLLLTSDEVLGAFVSLPPKGSERRAQAVPRGSVPARLPPSLPHR